MSTLSLIPAGVYGTILLMAAYVAIAAGGGGCEAVRHAADDVRGVTLGQQSTMGSSTQPSTQPSAHDRMISAAHAGVQIAETVAPSITPIVSLVGGLAALVGAIAGGLAGSSATKTRYGGALAEVADDIATFRDPTTAWTGKTRDLLVSLGKLSAAFPQGGTVTADSTGGAKA